MQSITVDSEQFTCQSVLKVRLKRIRLIAGLVEPIARIAKFDRVDLVAYLVPRKTPFAPVRTGVA